MRRSRASGQFEDDGDALLNVYRLAIQHGRGESPLPHRSGRGVGQVGCAANDLDLWDRPILGDGGVEDHISSHSLASSQRWINRIYALQRGGGNDLGNRSSK